MKRILLTLAAVPMILTAQPMKHYWQQRVHYTMDIDFDVKKHQFKGEQTLVYYNNSPDTLTEVFYHLYFNAFQPGSMMDARSRDLPDPDKRVGSRISKLKEKEIGYHRVSTLAQANTPLAFTVEQTLLRAPLAYPLAPGDSTVLQMKFESQVPVQIRRSGRNNAEGVDYTMTQWYPKLAAYDEDGWHPDPYVAREFYGVFGTFDVSIAIDYRYSLGGTGTLVNEEAKWQPTERKEGIQHYRLMPNKKEKRQWRFRAENVHDFAWAADEEFIRTSIPGPDGLQLNFYYLPGPWQKNWEQLPEYTSRFFQEMNQQFGTYAYPQFSVIQGGDGGMEYPMCTMLKGTGKLEGLVGVMVHESAHNWYYGMLASNENQYPWMDEGFTSFAEEEVLNILWDENKTNPHQRAYRNYDFLVQQKEVEPMATPADYFNRNRSYGISSYSRGQIFLAQLRYIIGDAVFHRAMLEYYEQWHFKHPDPDDFIRVMEKTSGIQLDWYLNFWVYTTKTIDYALKEVDKSGRGQSRITLERKGTMPMALVVEVTEKSGTKSRYQVPLVSMFGHRSDIPALAPWPWTHREYSFELPVNIKDLESVVIDPDGFMADVDRENNLWKERD